MIPARRSPWAVAAVTVLGALAMAGPFAGSARAANDDLDVSPTVVAPGGRVTVAGTCPDPVVGDYRRATVGVDAIGRYVVVEVRDGAFEATFRARGVGDVGDPEPGDDLRAQVSCATAESYVATVGTVKVDVVTEEEAATAAVASATEDASLPEASTTPAGSKKKAKAEAKAEAKAKASQTVAANQAGAVDPNDPISPWIPIAALAVAVAGTIGAFTVSRRGDQRAAAMTGHPAQHGVGRPDGENDFR